MSMVTLSQKTKRVYHRKFDHEEAAELHQRGYSLNTLAAHYGVSQTAILRVVNPAQRVRIDENARRYQRSGICPDCGGQMTAPSPSRTHEMCRICKDRRRSEESLLAKIAPNGDIQCPHCGEYKPPERTRWKTTKAGVDIPRRCLDCETKNRSDHRQRNRERERAADHERRRRWIASATPEERDRVRLRKNASERARRARKRQERSA